MAVNTAVMTNLLAVKGAQVAVVFVRSVAV
jgi:hypothetical protein